MKAGRESGDALHAIAKNSPSSRRFIDQDSIFSHRLKSASTFSFPARWELGIRLRRLHSQSQMKPISKDLKPFLDAHEHLSPVHHPLKKLSN
jgi:hypothetical protein